MITQEGAHEDADQLRARRHDTEDLNEHTLRFVVGADAPQRVFQELSMHAVVGALIKNAGPEGYRAAIRCGVPLVCLHERVVEDLTGQGPKAWRVRRESVQVPEALAEINLRALLLAQQMCLTNVALAGCFFGLPTEQVQVLAHTSVTAIKDYADQSKDVVYLRGGAQPSLWQHLLIGEHISGARGMQLSHEAALLSLGWRHTA